MNAIDSPPLPQSSTQTQSQPPAPPQTPPPPQNPQSYEPLLWDTARSEGSRWTRFTLDLIGNDLDQYLLPGTEDVTDFCPRYYSMSRDQKIHFWGLLISAMTKYESGFNPLSRMKETTLGTDSVTGLPVYSEGLLQLSYGDMNWAPYCKFDWHADKKLSPTDPRKTILDPYRNLNCGLRIFSKQIVRTNLIAAPAGSNYWSVLIPKGKYTKLSKIQALTQTQRSCHF